MNINLIKATNNYKDYNYFYKSLKELVLNESNFTILSNFFKVVIIIFNFNISLEVKAINRVEKNIRLK
ncbi:hypothetical protein C8035_v001968 [Colletotrichum spinosum]|uniref:Uncharacterized protein n=1 Tax=Colletotrichum spinosum TaxID=1347390 RepID=A0A4R8PVG9_9PEZI|nr:hypothetical protein C8035_v001968 [Colletotrichum spinosum]